MSNTEFDRHVDTYDRDLAAALSVTGESKDYYAEGRVNWLASRLRKLNAKPQRILDFGCGIGSNSPILKDTLEAKLVMGVDVSAESIGEARQKFGREELQFQTLENYQPDSTYDLAFTNGVFHHIPVADRVSAMAVLRDSLRPGGLFAFWENNPWNPGTQYVMSRCAFDENAVKITIPEARKLLSAAAFEVLRTDSLFYFPRQLRFLRSLESWLSALPLGGQYLILGRKK